MDGGSVGSAERSRRVPRERGRSSSVSISKVGGSPRGSDIHNFRSGASSLEVTELWNVLSRWNTGGAGRPLIAKVDIDASMVGQVRADPRQVNPDRDPVGAQARLARRLSASRWGVP